MKKKNVLVSGSHGFIGKHLCNRLAKEGYKPIAIPRELLIHDPIALEDLIKKTKPEFVFHLASYGNHSNQRVITDVVNVNVAGTFNLLSACAGENIKGIVNIGSSSEYGHKRYTMREDDVCEPVSLYGATKLATTAIVKAFSFENRQQAITVRPFSVYGQGEADFRFIPTVIRKILQREELQLIPEQGHDWIYVEDFVDGIIKIMDEVPFWNGEVVNLGTGIETSNTQIVEMLLRMSDTRNLKMKLVEPERMIDSPRWVADISKAKQYGWQPKTSLQEGLTKTFAYYKELYEPTRK